MLRVVVANEYLSIESAVTLGSPLSRPTFMNYVKSGRQLPFGKEPEFCENLVGW